MGKELRVQFKVIETYPDRVVTRLDLEGVDFTSLDEERLTVGCEDYLFSIKLIEEE